MRSLSVITLMVLLTGCVGLTPSVEQSAAAGITNVEITFKDDCADTVASCVSHVKWRDGKEAHDLAVKIDLQDGVFTYRRQGTKAFKGQAIRAAVEEAIAAQNADVSIAVIDAITDNIMTRVVIP